MSSPPLRPTQPHLQAPLTVVRIQTKSLLQWMYFGCWDGGKLCKKCNLTNCILSYPNSSCCSCRLFFSLTSRHHLSLSMSVSPPQSGDESIWVASTFVYNSQGNCVECPPPAPLLFSPSRKFDNQGGWHNLWEGYSHSLSQLSSKIARKPLARI